MEHTPYQEPTATQPEAPKNKSNRAAKVLGTSVGALLILFAGVGIGNASNPEPEVVEVEVEAEGETKTETVTDVVEVAPRVCIEAIDQASGMFGDIGTMFGTTMYGIFEAIEYLDVPALQEHVADFETFSDDFSVEADEYNRLKVECAGYPVAD